MCFGNLEGGVFGGGQQLCAVYFQLQEAGIGVTEMASTKTRDKKIKRRKKLVQRARESEHHAGVLAARGQVLFEENNTSTCDQHPG